MKTGKAAGPDGVTVEALSALGTWGLDKITDLLNLIYDKGEIPDEMCKSVFIMLPKKPGATECGLHRIISLMSHLTKILLRVLIQRMRNKLRPEVSNSQFGFVEDRGTRNAIFTLSMMIERTIEMKKDLHLCFIDYAKAFDRVKHEKLFTILHDLDIDGKGLRIIRNLYWDQTAATRLDNELSEFKPIKRGVRQGCVLSPDFFNIYSEMIMRKIQDKEGTTIGGANFNNLQYADDTVLIAESQTALQETLDVVTAASQDMGLDLNTRKIECMVTTKKSSKPCHLTSKGDDIKQVESFKYLGYTLSSNGKCLKEVKIRISMAKEAFSRMRAIFKNRSISIGTKIRLMTTYVWSILLYGCESWTLDKDIERRLEAAEMWFLRRILRISWTDKVKNEEVLRRADVTKKLVQTIRKRQLSFLGHVYRKDDLERAVLTGRIKGKRDRGRQRLTYLESLNTWVNKGAKSKSEFLRVAERREDWRLMIADVCNSPGT